MSWSHSSQAASSGLFIDESGFICCGGRIHKAPLSQFTRFPYLLPSRHPFTSMIIHSTNVRLFHAGINKHCYSHSADVLGTKTEATHPLTIKKLSCQQETLWTTIFTIGKNEWHHLLIFFYVQRNGVESKVCICPFTCATTRGVHLEIMTNLATDTFLLALKRFMSRKSLPQVIVFDSGLAISSVAASIGSPNVQNVDCASF